jgi:hypothetical protein
MEIESGNTLPAILLYGFEHAESFCSIAFELHSKGFPTVAVCTPGDAGAEGLRGAGCIIIEAEDGNALRAGLEYFNRSMTDLPGVVAVNLNDGYSVDDILKAAETLIANPTKPIIASRTDE